MGFLFEFTYIVNLIILSLVVLSLWIFIKEGGRFGYIFLHSLLLFIAIVGLLFFIGSKGYIKNNGNNIKWIIVNAPVIIIIFRFSPYVIHEIRELVRDNIGRLLYLVYSFSPQFFKNRIWFMEVIIRYSWHRDFYSYIKTITYNDNEYIIGLARKRLYHVLKYILSHTISPTSKISNYFDEIPEIILSSEEILDIIFNCYIGYIYTSEILVIYNKLPEKLKYNKDIFMRLFRFKKYYFDIEDNILDYYNKLPEIFMRDKDIFICLLDLYHNELNQNYINIDFHKKLPKIFKRDKDIFMRLINFHPLCLEEDYLGFYNKLPRVFKFNKDIFIRLFTPSSDFIYWHKKENRDNFKKIYLPKDILFIYNNLPIRLKLDKDVIIGIINIYDALCYQFIEYFSIIKFYYELPEKIKYNKDIIKRLFSFYDKNKYMYIKGKEEYLEDLFKIYLQSPDEYKDDLRMPLYEILEGNLGLIMKNYRHFIENDPKLFTLIYRM